jgi:hypothetical protein
MSQNNIVDRNQYDVEHDLVKTIKQYMTLEQNTTDSDEWIGVCPFHEHAEQDGKTFYVLQNNHTFYKNGEYYCEKCGRIGDADAFIRMITGNLNSFDKEYEFSITHPDEYLKQRIEYAKEIEADIVDTIRQRLADHHPLGPDSDIDNISETKEYINKLINEGKCNIYPDLDQILEALDHHYVIPYSSPELEAILDEILGTDEK